MLVKSVTINRRNFDAAIFDLDGVLTDTARVHAAAWKAVFHTFLRRWAQRHGLAFQPFDIEANDLAYVDGRPRYDGIRSFLAVRAINLPEDRTMTLKTRIQCARSVSARRDCFGKRCKKESIRQRVPKRF